MKKKKTTSYLDASLIYDNYHDANIDDVIGYLIASKDRGATHVEIHAKGYPDADSIELSAVIITEESDEEFAKRIEAKELWEKQKEEAELESLKKTYEVLKQKFEPKL